MTTKPNDDSGGDEPPEPSKTEVVMCSILGIGGALCAIGAAFAIGFLTPAPYRYFCAVPIYLFCVFGIGENAVEALVPALIATFVILMLVLLIIPGIQSTRKKRLNLENGSSHTQVPTCHCAYSIEPTNTHNKKKQPTLHPRVA